MIRKYFEKELIKLLEKDCNFKIALDLIGKIGSGKVWLFGSAIYKNLIKIKHDFDLPIDDYDFIIEKIKNPLPKLVDWEITQNTFGNWRFKKNGIIVDPVPINNILLLNEWGWKPNIRNFMRQVGFSVQAIVFDIKRQRLMGQKAIDDINERKIRINNKKTYKQSIAKYGDKVNLSNMAKKLKLKPVNK